MDRIRRTNILNVYHHKAPDFVPLYSDLDHCIPSGIGESPDFAVDAWGVKWIFRAGQPGPMPDESIPPILEDVTRWCQVVQFPDNESFDWSANAAKDTALWDRENRISNVIMGNGLWERFSTVCGMENALCNLLTEPEDSFDFLSAIADSRIACLEKIAQYYRPDKIQFHDDYGTETRLMFSLNTWRELIKPNLKRVIDACHHLGMIYEHHSCGYIAPLLDDLIELGADAWNPVQYSNDPEALLRRYHDRFTLVGGFDDRIGIDPTKTDADIRASITHTVNTLGPLGGWIPYPTVKEEYIPFVNAEVHRFNRPAYETLGFPAEAYRSDGNSSYITSVFEKASQQRNSSIP